MTDPTRRPSGAEQEPQTEAPAVNAPGSSEESRRPPRLFHKRRRSEDEAGQSEKVETFGYQGGARVKKRKGRSFHRTSG